MKDITINTVEHRLMEDQGMKRKNERQACKAKQIVTFLL